MSNSVVPAAAVAQAKHLVNNKKLTKQADDHKPARDEQDQKASDHEPESAKAVQTEDAQQHSSSMSDISLSGDFSFSGALADAAAGSASLASEGSSAQDEGGYSDDSDGGISSTVLLVGAVGLVGAGIAVAASGGGGGSNEAPTVDSATQSVTTAEDTPKAVTVAATDPDGDTLTYSVTTAAAHGTVTGGAGGAFTYTPSANYNGTDSFVVTATDPKGETVTQTVNVTISAVNDAPVPSAENTPSLTVNEDASGQFVIDFEDPEGDAVSASLVTGPAHGTLNEATNTYTPAANYNGADSITYSVTDANGASTTFTLAITVTPVNDAPVAEDAAASTAANTAVEVTVAAVDVDGDTLAYTAADPAHGTVAAGTGGTFTYTPDTDFAGADSFTVTVDDGHGGTDTALVSVNVGVASVTLDVGSQGGDPVTLQAGAGDFIFTDDATVVSNVVIQGFGAGDSIDVSGVPTLDTYNFTTGSGAAGVDDLRIEYTDTVSGNSNIILIEDVLNGGIVANYATAAASVGFDFMTIG